VRVMGISEAAVRVAGLRDPWARRARVRKAGVRETGGK
jgi:hypothetical protein